MDDYDRIVTSGNYGAGVNEELANQRLATAYNSSRNLPTAISPVIIQPVGGRVSGAVGIDAILTGLEGDNRDIVKEKLLTYSRDQINELRNLSENDRK